MTSDSHRHSLADLHERWSVTDSGTAISCRFTVKNFNEALLLTNLCASVAEQENHHPDICLGWGYCQISFTTHSSGTLTPLDFTCAGKLDKMVAILNSDQS